ncbi:hypothetical protein FRB95_013364 [Tulasnella sp. JGI-2019a]|nr:hypothetical protein FRB95_013364 [Tulasnella sp. JGI-2019a]
MNAPVYDVINPARFRFRFGLVLHYIPPPRLKRISQMMMSFPQETIATSESIHRNMIQEGQSRLVEYIRQARSPHPPQQIHELGLMPVQQLPRHIPPRAAGKEKDFEEIIRYLHPAMYHLLHPNIASLSPDDSCQQMNGPLLHPQYAEGFYHVISNLQPHKIDSLTLNLLECGHELYRNLDAFFAFTVREWYELIRDASESYPGDGSEDNNYGKRVLDLYQRAFKQFHQGVITIDHLCTPLNEHYVVMRDLATGGYHWMSQDERTYVNNGSGKQGARKRTERIDEMLNKWGYHPKGVASNCASEERTNALLCALASTDTRVVVPVAQLGLKWWRVGLLEPFIARGIFASMTWYLSTVELGKEEKRQVISELMDSLRKSGVDPTHHIFQDLKDLVF